MSTDRLDISKVVDQHLCNSCGGCFAACKQGAIQYTETVGGYLFPIIDTDACTHCGLCYQICPGANFGKTLSELVPQDPFTGTTCTCHVGRAAENDIFRNSQSGGIATALICHLFDTGQVDSAIVAVMDKGLPPRGEVRVVSNKEGLKQAQKSKYSPIPLLKALRQLPAGTSRVALVGLPCQMHGLYNLQDVIPEYQEIFFFKIGLVCDRVLTLAAIDHIGGQATKDPLDGLVWRDKQKYSYPGNPVVYTTGGREIVLKASQRMMIKDFFTPVRCRLCFDKLNVYADVTLGDPHNIEGVDRLRGESMILVRTGTGRKLVEDANRHGKLVLRTISAEEAIRGQGIEKKRCQWTGYMWGWEEMGRTPPNFPFTPPPSTSVVEQIHWLRHGLQLDQFPSRATVLCAADKWVFRFKVRRAWRWPFSKIKRLLCLLKRGLMK